MTSYLIHANGTAILNEEFGEDSVVVFKSSTIKSSNQITAPSNFDNTSLNLISKSGSTLLHISLRTHQNTIVLNTKANGGGWGEEEYVSLDSVRGGNHMIAVYERNNTYMILFGTTVHHIYKKRINEKGAKIQYGINTGQNLPIFSDPIPVNVFKMDNLLKTLSP